MLEKLGSDAELGIVMVAIGGASIEAFKKDISSEGCGGNGADGFHFCAAGYRILGERYADKMISLMGKQ